MVSSGPARRFWAASDGEASSKPGPVGVGPPLAIRLGVDRLRATHWPSAPRALLTAVVGWLARCASADRERLVLWLPVAFGAGIALYFALPFEPASTLGLGLAIAGVLLVAASVATESAVPRAALAAVAVVLVGFGLAKHRTDSVAAPVLHHRMAASRIDARVDSVEVRDKGVRTVLAVASIERWRGSAPPKRVRISIRSGGETLKPGDWIAVKAVLMPPPDPAEPGDYDFGRAAFFRQIGAVGYAFGKPAFVAPRFEPGFSDRISIAIELLRWRMSARIHSVLPGSTGAIAAALITGDRGGISDEDEAALRDAGLAHVLAIAGLHMALVGLGLFWVVRALLALFPPIALRYPIKKWAAVAALLGAAFYLVISGAATPATRAFIMLAVMLVAILFERPAISMRSVGFAATIILALRPETIIEPGFQMSFAAVAGLVAVAEWERTRQREAGETRPFGGIRRYVRGIATTSLVGSLATAPYAAFHFDRATHYAVLGNLGAMPIMGFITMPAAALAVILMPFGLDAYPLHVMGWGIEVMLAIGRWVSALPGSISPVSAWPMSALILLTIGGLWILLWRASWRWLGLSAVLAGGVVIVGDKPPDLLVSRDGVTVALREADDRLHFLRVPADKYSAEEWLKRDGDVRSVTDAISKTARCDVYGCTSEAAGLRIAAPHRADALAEDCGSADLVISAIPTRRRCVGPRLVIDRFDVSRNGSYAIWFGDKITVGTAQDARGNRPWSVPSPQYRRTRPTSLPWMRTRSDP